MLANTQNSAMVNFPNGISPVNYVPPPNRPYTPPWNSKDACRVYCDCGGSYDTDVRSTVGRMMTFIRNDQVDPKVRHEQSARHQKWQKNPQKTKIRQVIMHFVGNQNSYAIAVLSFEKIQKRFIAHAVATIQTA